MRLFITGATGTIGQRLVADRLARGDQIVVVSRNCSRAEQLMAVHGRSRIEFVQSDVASAGDWQNQVAGCHAVVHLAGAGVADRRWSRAYKRTLFTSRVESTRHIVKAIADCTSTARPRVLINGSAIGYYGDGGERELDEHAPQGSDFLAELTAKWEAEAAQATAIAKPSVRVVLLRTSVVLDYPNGALRKMMLPFRMFAGGPIGSGRQWTSWIHWRDLVGLIDFAIEHERVEGPLNASSPQMMRNRDFARALGKAMHRPSLIPTPMFALRMVMGEVANAITNSAKVIPAKAQQCGYAFAFPELESALADLIGNQR